MMFGVPGWEASTEGSSGFNAGGEISRVVAHPTPLGAGELPEDSGSPGDGWVVPRGLKLRGMKDGYGIILPSGYRCRMCITHFNA